VIQLEEIPNEHSMALSVIALEKTRNSNFERIPVSEARQLVQ
jgi:hypothetical protein